MKSCLHPVPPEGALLGPTLAHAACGSRPSHPVSLGLGLNTIAGHDSYIPQELVFHDDTDSRQVERKAAGRGRVIDL